MRLILLLCLCVGSLQCWGTNSQLPANFKSLPDDVQALLLEYAFFSAQVKDHWGGEAEFAAQKEYVKYLDDYLSRAVVDYEQGLLRVETLASSEPQKQLEEAIVTTLLTPDDPNGVDIFSASNVKTGGKPFLLGLIVDADNQPIASVWRARQFARYLLEHNLRVRNTVKGKLYSVSVPMVASHTQVAANHFMPAVQAAAQRYSLPPSLILGIIETESGFNPYAVSAADAYGLMQVVPTTAGADYFEKILKKSGRPSRNYLLEPENNIMAGSGYIAILRDYYLNKIEDPYSLLYCIISAYNGGAGNVFKTFSADRNAAVTAINRMGSDQVLWYLQNKHPSEESRRYLQKVLAHQEKYY